MLLTASMDGRVARLTHTQSEFGVQMDIEVLADAVSFGIALRSSSGEFALVEMGKTGWAVSFVYVASLRTLRPARFNCNVGAEQELLSGAPSAPAVLVCGFVWLVSG